MRQYLGLYDFCTAFFICNKEELEVKENKTIDTSTNYGSIKLLLKEKMIEKGISIEELCNKTGIEKQMINDYCNNNNRIINSNILSKICNILNCTIKDIMKYDVK